MKKLSKILIVFLLINPLNVLCQTINIGQNADEVKQLIDYQVQSYYRSQGYHQVREEQHTDYKNGQISDVILCQENVPLIDLGQTADFCTHYVMNKGRLNYIQIQYANISIEKLENIMSKNNIHIGNYYFGDDDKTYTIIYLSANQQAVKEIRSRLINPIPVNIQKEFLVLKRQKEVQRAQADMNAPFDPSQAVNYKGFSEQENKILYGVWQGMNFNIKVNIKYIVNANSSIKAVIAYYSGISYADELTEKLNLGRMCSNELISYISKYFNNNTEIMNQLSECKIRGIGDEYSLDRLELSEHNNKITVSYAMTYFKNNESQDDVIGVDEFKVNPDQSLSILTLSSKESIKKKSAVINSKVYDVQKTAPDIYEKFKLQLRSELIRVIKTGNRNIPSFSDFFGDIDKPNFSPSWSISNNYGLNWRTYYDYAGYMQISRNDTVNKGVDNYWALLYSCKVDMPSIKVDGINAKFVTLTVKNIEVDFTKGISLARIKDDLIEYSKYPPSPEVMAKIKEKVTGAHYKGYFLITYEVGDVMGEDYKDINFEKIKNNVYKTPDGWIIKL